MRHVGPERRMHERLAEVLAADIVSGTIAEGEHFPSSDELVREFGVSRTVARETVQALVSAGLISVQHGKRSTVAPSQGWRLLDPLVQAAIGQERQDRSLVIDMWETRRCVEPYAALRCAERASDDQLAQLVELADAALAAARGWSAAEAAVESTSRDWRFHGAVANGSGNRVLAGVVRDAHRGVSLAWRPARPTLRQITEGFEQHCAIADALAARAGVKAARLVDDHILWWQQALDELPSQDERPAAAVAGKA